MKKIILLLIVIAQSSAAFAQLPSHVQDKISYPVFDFDPWVGVIKKKTKALKYDKDLEYKVVIDVYDRIKDSTAVMGTLREVARSYNLNIVNGVPRRKFKMAVVVHGGAIRGILTDEAYERNYGVPNPNTEILRLMKKEGIEFYACGQNLSYRQIPDEDVSKDVKIALSAKTALITLDQMGYTYMNVNEN